MTKSESTHQVAEESEAEPAGGTEKPVVSQDIAPGQAPGAEAGGPPEQIKPDGR